MENPKFDISVVIPAHNNPQFLIHAVNSSLKQKFPNQYEILIVGQKLSPEARKNILGLKSGNIRYINDEGVGVASALNLGITESNFDWIARLDSDDIMHPDRIENQVRYLLRHPSCVAIGGQMVTIDIFGQKLHNVKYPINNFAIKFALKVNSPLPHPGTLIKKSALEMVGKYDENYESVEDFDLWRKLAKVGNFHNLRNTVIYYRIHSGQVTNQKSNQILFSRAKLIAENLTNLREVTTDLVYDLAKLEQIIFKKSYKQCVKFILSSKENKKVLIKYLFYKFTVRSIGMLRI